MVAGILMFVCFVMFKMVTSLVDSVTPVGLPAAPAAATSLPDISGDWKIAYVQDQAQNTAPKKPANVCGYGSAAGG